MHPALLAGLTVGLDWLGTLAFALSGALLGVRKRFDIFGVLVLAYVTAVAGGMMRDVLIGAVPPVALSHIHYFLIAMAGGLAAFYAYPRIAALNSPIQISDALGLGLFAVTGAQKALEHGINPLMAALLGMLTGVGGGMVRDVLAQETPFVLRGELYAVTALAGAAVVPLGDRLGAPPLFTLPAGAVVCVVLRLLAVWRGWRAPIARTGQESGPG